MTPGIVGDWKASRHAKVTSAAALRKPALERRLSAAGAPEGQAESVVGWAERHTRNADRHPDSCERNGHRVRIVVSPEGCAGRHSVEREQYAVNGVAAFAGGAFNHAAAAALTDADSCLSCHGTKVEVKGVKPRDTAMGEMTLPVLGGWPKGVGRVNPDGSQGACTAATRVTGSRSRWHESRRPAASVTRVRTSRPTPSTSWASTATSTSPSSRSGTSPPCPGPRGARTRPHLRDVPREPAGRRR